MHTFNRKFLHLSLALALWSMAVALDPIASASIFFLLASVWTLQWRPTLDAWEARLIEGVRRGHTIAANAHAILFGSPAVRGATRAAAAFLAATLMGYAAFILSLWIECEWARTLLSFLALGTYVVAAVLTNNALRQIWGVTASLGPSHGDANR